jgi:hypothetical protein
LDPHGQLGSDPGWWKEVFIAYAPPPEIQEIWSGALDWIDDETEAWFFEALQPTNGSVNSRISSLLERLAWIASTPRAGERDGHNA